MDIGRGNPGHVGVENPDTEEGAIVPEGIAVEFGEKELVEECLVLAEKLELKVGDSHLEAEQCLGCSAGGVVVEGVRRSVRRASYSLG
ncbi:hypothetical protein LINGRAHAP2_LOCUS23802 [Linum grandiflorum]